MKFLLLNTTRCVFNGEVANSNEGTPIALVQSGKAEVIALQSVLLLQYRECVDKEICMSRFISMCLLALAVLQGAIPADHCILKLAGICCCDSPPTQSEKQSCCHEMDASQPTTHSSNCPLNDNNRKPCCAYTPANAMTADAQAVPLVDAHLDVLASAHVAFGAPACIHCAQLALASRSDSLPQPFDVPLHLRVHFFLI